MGLRFASIGMVLILAGCAAGSWDQSYDTALDNPDTVAARVTMNQTQFDDGPTFVGPPLIESHPESFPQRQLIQLAQTRDGKTGKIQDAVLATFWYQGDWAFFRSVNYQGGKIQKLDRVDRKVGSCYGGCDFTESTILLLPEGFLENKAKTGFSLRYNTDRHGPAVIWLQASYVQGFLSGIRARTVPAS